MDKERKATIHSMVENYYTQLSLIEVQPDLTLEVYLKNLELGRDEIEFGLSIGVEIDSIIYFMRARNIDSFQKVRLVLFLQQQPEWTGTAQMLAKKLHLGNVPLVEGMITALQEVGLVKCIEDRFKLRDDPDIKLQLQHLVRAYENPLTRPWILEQLKPGVSKQRYLAQAHKPYSEKLK
jgi:hypothetical protein